MFQSNFFTVILTTPQREQTWLTDHINAGKLRSLAACCSAFWHSVSPHSWGACVLGWLSGCNKRKVSPYHPHPHCSMAGPQPPPTSSPELLTPKPVAKKGLGKQLNYDQGQGGNFWHHSRGHGPGVSAADSTDGEVVMGHGKWARFRVKIPLPPPGSWGLE